MSHVIHYVNPNLESHFLLETRKGKTKCGLKRNSIVEHSTNIEWITCVRCLKSLNVLIKEHDLKGDPVNIEAKVLKRLNSGVMKLQITDPCSSILGKIAFCKPDALKVRLNQRPD